MSFVSGVVAETVRVIIIIIIVVIILFINSHQQSVKIFNVGYTFQQCGLNGLHRVKPLTCRHNTIK